LAADKETILLELLVLRCKRGDAPAFAELVRTWERRLFFYVRRLVGSEEDAWDVLQQTWLKVVQGIKALDNPRHLPAWLYSIARRTAMSQWRDYYREQLHIAEQADVTEVADEGDNDCGAFENAEQVAAGLSRISLDHREVLTLYFLNDLSLNDIAAVLDIPQGTVKSRLSYAKRALRAVLEQENGGHV
jgi:RNA polymerase sigma-70 factor (ECF subfamily)